MKGGLGPVGLLMKSLGSSAVEINSCAHWPLVPSCKLTASLLGRGGETGWGRSPKLVNGQGCVWRIFLTTFVSISFQPLLESPPMH